MEYAQMWTLRRRRYYLRLRYIVMEVKSEYYLIDTDSSSFWWGYICPIIHWIVPHTAMKINLPSSEINKILLDKVVDDDVREKRSFKKRNLIIYPVVMSLLRPVSFLIGDYLGDSSLSMFMNYLVSILGISLLIWLKIFILKKNKKIINIIGEKNLSKVKISLVPDSFGEALKIVYVFVILTLLFFIFSFMIFLGIGADSGARNPWFGYVSGLSFFSAYLFINRILISTRYYKVKFREVD